jgi:fatty acid desaturase
MEIRPDLRQRPQNDPDHAKRITPIKLAKQLLQNLSQLNLLISIYHIVQDWTAIVLAAALCQHFWNPLLYVAVVAFIGGRQHALLILMHEGAHHRLFRGRRLNDWIAELLLAWPHFATMRAYREHHLAHHGFLNSDRDPDWRRKKDNSDWHFPKSPTGLLGIFVRDVSGLGGINLLRLAASMGAAERLSSKEFKCLRLLFYLAAFGTIIDFGAEKTFVLYWVVPYFTWLCFVMRVRSIAEHFAIDGAAGAYAYTRTTYAGPLARVFVAPKNINYHIEHHFFPSVPFHRLPQLHAVLMSHPEYASSAHITVSYWKVMLECVRQSSPAAHFRKQISCYACLPWRA